MSLSEFSFLLVSIALGVAGQFFLKTGALKLGRVGAHNAFSHVLSIATTPELIIGLVMYACSAVFYILLLTRVKLSVIGPSVSIGYVFSVLMGYFIFREAITARHLVGLGFIACGVILVAWRK